MPEERRDDSAQLGQEPSKMATRTSPTSPTSLKTKTKVTKLKSYFTKQVARDVMQLPKKGETLIDFYKYKPDENGRLVTKKRFQKRSGSRSGTDSDSDSADEGSKAKVRGRKLQGDKFREVVWDDERTNDREAKSWTSNRASDAADREIEGHGLEEMSELRQAEEAWAHEREGKGIGAQESGVVDAGHTRGRIS